jgi:hypothetical protein
MYVVHGGIVTGLKPTALSVATTCFQYHGYGRRTGLKIRCDLLNESVMAFDGEPRHSFSRTRDTWPDLRDNNWAFRRNLVDKPTTLAIFVVRRLDS